MLTSARIHLRSNSNSGNKNGKTMQSRYVCADTFDVLSRTHAQQNLTYQHTKSQNVKNPQTQTISGRNRTITSPTNGNVGQNFAIFELHTEQF